MYVDERIAEFLDICTRGTQYKLDRVEWVDGEESGGLHHIYVRVLDKEGNRVFGLPVALSNGGLSFGYTEEKPSEEWGDVNFPMTGTLGSYTVWVGPDVEESDDVAGMGLGTPEEPNHTIHTCFVLTFIRHEGDPPDPPPPDPPPPDPPDPDIERAKKKLRIALDYLLAAMRILGEDV